MINEFEVYSEMFIANVNSLTVLRFNVSCHLGDH